MKSRRLVVVPLVSLLAAACSPWTPQRPDGVQTRQETSAQPRVSGDLAEVLRWLPTTTETVMVTKGPRQASDREPNIETSFRLIASVLFFTEDTPQSASEHAKSLPRLDAEFTVFGSQNFEEPKGLGLAGFEGCLITAFKSVEDAASMTDWLERGEFTKKTLGGTAFFIRSNEVDDGGSMRDYFMGIHGRYFLVAVGESYLKSLLERIKTKHETVAFPYDLQQWKAVPATATMFGIRKVLKKPGNQLYNLEDKEVTGVVLVVEKDTMTVNWFSNGVSPFEQQIDPWLKVARREEGYTVLSAKYDPEMGRTLSYISMIGYLLGPALFI